MVRITPEFQSKYSDLANWIRRSLPDIPARKPDVWKAFKWYSQIDGDARAIDLLLDYESVPALRVENLDNIEKMINGQFRPDDPMGIYLCSEIADRWSDLSDAANGPKFQLLIESTILHELVHWGNYRHGDVYRGNPEVEWGTAFETKAYHRNVGRYWLPDPDAGACGTHRAVQDACNAGLNDIDGLAAEELPQSVGGAPFARSSARLQAWPIQTSHPLRKVVTYRDVAGRLHGPDAQRAFFAPRPGNVADSIEDDRHHVGLDLYGNAGDPVLACEAGEIVAFQRFYQGTMALLVLCESGIVINYGEVAPDSWGSLKIGSRVEAGMPIARIGSLARGSMCHFETYTGETRQTVRWKWNARRPDQILDPTLYLLNLARR